METKSGEANIAEGIASHYQPDLKRVRKQLGELTSKQAVVLRDLQKENIKFCAVDTNELNSMFHMMKDYHGRLVLMKREMMLLAEKSERLKKRALKLQEHKQKIALENAHYREAQLRREQDLIAKPDAHLRPL